MSHLSLIQAMQAGPLKRGPSLPLIGTRSAQGLGAVHLFGGALNSERFAWYGSRFLAPTLCSGEVLGLDNLAVQKLGGLREWLWFDHCGYQVQPA